MAERFQDGQDSEHDGVQLEGRQIDEEYTRSIQPAPERSTVRRCTGRYNMSFWIAWRLGKQLSLPIYYEAR